MNEGLALPLIALQNHEVRVNLAIRDFNELWVSNDNVFPEPVEITSCSLYVDYVFLDDTERKFFARNTHNYLITQLQINSNALDTSIIYKCNDDRDNCVRVDEDYVPQNGEILLRKSGPQDTSMVHLKFNHPVKELIWIIQTSDILTVGGGNDWFNFR